jgi:chromosome partitioning protein
MVLGITLINPKGGAGKSTVAQLLADVFAECGERVLLVDTDPRQNVKVWWDDCGSNNNQRDNLTVASATRESAMKAAIDAAEKDFDVVIFDTAGQDTALPGLCICKSQIIITPVQMSKPEIRGAMEVNSFMRQLVAAGAMRKLIPHLLVPTRMSMTVRHTDIFKTLQVVVDKIGSHLSQTELYERNHYKEMQNGYSSLLQLEGGTKKQQESIDKARAELCHFAAQVMELIGYQPKIHTARNGPLIEAMSLAKAA